MLSTYTYTLYMFTAYNMIVEDHIIALPPHKII